jgi:23S rRNA (uracil1939-C5)-methyltransferase
LELEIKKKNMLKSNTYEYVEITDFAAEGKCIFKSDDGVIFVEGNVAPGDIVDLQVVRTKKKLKEAVVTKIHSSSALRTTPYCEHHGVCGGCKWQHIGYEHQLRFKRQQVVDHFERIGKIRNVEINEIIAAPKTEYYRNKLEFTFSNWRWLTKEQMDSGEKFSKNALGFHVPKRFDKIFTVDQCHLQPGPSNEIRNSLHRFGEESGFPYYDVRFNVGVLRNLIVRTANSGDVMVIVQFGEQNDEAIAETMEYLQKNHPERKRFLSGPGGDQLFGGKANPRNNGRPDIPGRTEVILSDQFRAGIPAFQRGERLRRTYWQRIGLRSLHRHGHDSQFCGA